MKKDAVEYLNWRHNYNGGDEGWCRSVQDYIKHLEDTIINLEGTLELSGLEPQEVSHEEVVASCLDYIEQQKKFVINKSDHYIDMDSRLL